MWELTFGHLNIQWCVILSLLFQVGIFHKHERGKEEEKKSGQRKNSGRTTINGRMRRVMNNFIRERTKNEITTTSREIASLTKKNCSEVPRIKRGFWPPMWPKVVWNTHKLPRTFVTFVLTLFKRTDDTFYAGQMHFDKHTFPPEISLWTLNTSWKYTVNVFPPLQPEYYCLSCKKCLLW